MVKDIVPDRPADRRRRSRLCALRVMDRLGLLGEENMSPTLARGPDLRWLTDEEGAWWADLTELGRIGESGAFEEAVEWALEDRPSLEEAKTYIRCLRLRRHRPAPAGWVRGRTRKRAARSQRWSPFSFPPPTLWSLASARGCYAAERREGVLRVPQGAKPARLRRSR
jgi:hypothetical protein